VITVAIGLNHRGGQSLSIRQLPEACPLGKLPSLRARAARDCQAPEDVMAATQPMLIRETFPVGPLQCNCTKIVIEM